MVLWLSYAFQCTLQNALDVRGWFASDPFFFGYDCMTKMKLRMNNARRVVEVGSLKSRSLGWLSISVPYMVVKCLV